MTTSFLNQTEIIAADSRWADIYQQIQGNILKGHGRDHATMIFVSFKGKDKSLVRKSLGSFAEEHVTSFYTQLWERERYKRTKTPGNIFGSIFITHKGYQFLEPTTKLKEPAFTAGMKARASLLNDPKKVEDSYAREIHAMLLLADDDKTRMDKQVIQLLGRDWKVGDKDVFDILHIEYGDAIRNANGDGLEHNGYVDGISQPLFLYDEVEAYKQQHGITNKFVFDPRAKPGLVLVKDPYVNAKELGEAYGSYFVFRKLEQNVRAFKGEEEDIGNKIFSNDDDKERAGAMLVGRFEDGTPIKVSGSDRLIGSGVFNNFRYDTKTTYDPSDGRCPHFAHIRKTNPRKGGKFDQHTMARRGIPYGYRNVDTSIDGITAVQLPPGGVGLLFMSYQQSLVDQFEFIQQQANAVTSGGVDPVIGQINPSDSQQPYVFPKLQDPKQVKFDFHQHIHFKGGEYFFAPSMPYLRGLCKD